MYQHKYYIKGMVCERCILSVREVLAGLGANEIYVSLGQVVFSAPSQIPHTILEACLLPLGFELLIDKKTALVAHVKNLVEKVYSGNFDFPYNFRFFLYATQRLNTNPEAIREAFKNIERTNLEKYILDFRINKIKELLVYTDKRLADIAFKLGFTSVAHLSKQFKDYTGLTTSHFKKVKLSKDLTKA